MFALPAYRYVAQASDPAEATTIASDSLPIQAKEVAFEND
jgi:hypothetical protein